MRRFDDLIQHLSDDVSVVVALFDEGGRVLHVNSGFRDAFGIDAQDCSGRTMHQLVPGARGVQYAALVAEAGQASDTITRLSMVQGRIWRIVLRRFDDPSTGTTVMCSAMPLAHWNLALKDGDRLLSEHHFGPLAVMTDRELEVYRLLGMSKTVPEIARVLHRSARTIETHREAIGQKLNISGRVALALHSANSGLTSLPDAQFASLLETRRQTTVVGDSNTL